MDKVSVGTVIKDYLSKESTTTSANLTVNLTDSISVGDKVTFDGWPDEINASIIQINQGNTDVTTAMPGKSKLTIDKPGFIIFDSNIYKIISSEQTQEGSQSSNWFLDKSGYWALHLSTTAAEFLNDIPSYAQKLIAKYKTTPAWFLVIVVIVVLIFIIPPVIAPLIAILGYRFFLLSSILLLILGGPLLYFGLREFSLEQLLISTPVVKIDAAAYNLNKIQGKFIPYNTEPLKAPISGLDCVYYSVGIVFNNQKQNSLPLALTAKGIPTLFEDESGYLAVDLEKVTTLDMVVNSIEINLKQDWKTTLNEDYATLLNNDLSITKTLMPFIKEAEKNKSNLDLSQISAQIPDANFKPLKSLIFDISSLPSPNPAHYPFFNLTLAEACLPVNSDYTCIGGVTDTGKVLNGKPVKGLVPDRNGGMMMVHAGTAQSTTKKISKATYAKIILAIILIIAALGSISFYISDASAAGVAAIGKQTIITTTATTSVTTIPTTTILPSAPLSNGQAKISNISCGNFTLTDAMNNNNTYGKCRWKGGKVNISAGGGLSGWIFVRIIGSDGIIYFSNATDSWCPANIGSVYLPAQNYGIVIDTGNGNGSCGNATVMIRSSNS